MTGHQGEHCVVVTADEKYTLFIAGRGDGELSGNNTTKHQETAGQRSHRRVRNLASFHCVPKELHVELHIHKAHVPLFTRKQVSLNIYVSDYLGKHIRGGAKNCESLQLNPLSLP